MSQRMGKPIWATGLKYPNPPWNGPSLSLGALDFDLYQPLMNRNWFIAAFKFILYAFMTSLMLEICWNVFYTILQKYDGHSGLSPGFMQTYPSPPENKSGCGLWIHGLLKFHCFEMLFRKRSIRNSKWVGQLSHYLQPFFLHPFAFGIAVLPALSPTIAWTYSCRQFWKCRLRASETSLIRNRLDLQLPPKGMIFHQSRRHTGLCP